MDRGAWWATVHRVTRVRHNLATKPPLPPMHAHTHTHTHTHTHRMAPYTRLLWEPISALCDLAPKFCTFIVAPLGNHEKWKKAKVLVTQSCPTLVTPPPRWTPQSMEFSRQEYWGGLTLSANPSPPARETETNQQHFGVHLGTVTSQAT